MRNGWLCLLLLGLAACSSAPPPRLPPALEQAQAADRDGHRAMRDGDLAVARNLFEQSLRLQQSQDNLPGVATAANNLAAVYHRMGNDAMALRLLDGILGDPLTPYTAELRTAAAFRKAVILVDSKNREAPAALDAAAQLCSGSCEFAAGIYNLRARMALGKGDYATAIKLAKDAADASGKHKDELANAKRYSADAEAASGQQPLALENYLAALELDKQLGISGRIAEDLDGVARTLAQLGRKDEAASYARRAAAAHEALHDKPVRASVP